MAVKPKTIITLEFSRPLLVDRVPRKGSHEIFSAEPKELLALAKRFDIPQLLSVRSHLVATPWRGGGLKIAGRVDIELDQISVVSLEVFRSQQKFEVERYFLPHAALADAGEVDADEIVEGEVDLGEVVAETLGLELNPYPRKPGEAFPDLSDEGPKH